MQRIWRVYSSFHFCSKFVHEAYLKFSRLYSFRKFLPRLLAVGNNFREKISSHTEIFIPFPMVIFFSFFRNKRKTRFSAFMNIDKIDIYPDCLILTHHILEVQFLLFFFALFSLFPSLLISPFLPFFLPLHFSSSYLPTPLPPGKKNIFQYKYKVNIKLHF